MGLAEKRAVAAYQKDKFPGWKQKLNEISGIELELDIAWDQLAKEGYSAEYGNMFDYNFFQPLEGALKSICQDDLGRDALKAKIKKVQITSTRSWCSLEAKVNGDTLHVDADPSYERSDGSVTDYTKRITTVLEAVL
ncbi:hypothetical protein [Hyalangium rubrum]|uniref:Uncharacterized protein n=1 Tax=Hyalangium rubrum TaxID=3103134 RepID=A0ABU5HG57_9BACT|nr:hypothetical protein [Hyalangium sp. s54d21]MDY7232459.1 hypothetical protein [Hyalangium sp. s54d21]